MQSQPIAVLTGIAATALLALGAAAQTPAAPRQMVVTVMSKTKAEPPAMTANDIAIREGSALAPVSAVTRAAGESGRMDLYVLFDRDAGTNLMPVIPLVRDFLTGLPPSTRIGFGYLTNNGIDMRFEPVAPRPQVIEAVSSPSGGISPSPFESIARLVAQWKPEPGVRHEIIAFTDGETPVFTDVADNPLIRKLTPEFQQAGVVFYGVYVPGSGVSTDVRQVNSGAAAGAGLSADELGQTNLDAMARSTGGTAYFGLSKGSSAGAAPLATSTQAKGSSSNSNSQIGFTSNARVSLATGLNVDVVRSYLDDIRVRMDHQYLVDYTPAPSKKTGPQGVKVVTEYNTVALSAQNGIVVP